MTAAAALFIIDTETDFSEGLMIHFEAERLILRNCTMDGVPAEHEYFSNEEVSYREDLLPMTIEEVADGNPIMIRPRVYKLTV